MKKNKPFSAVVYIKENKERTAVCVLMMFLGTLMFLAGNYIYSQTNMCYVDEKYSDSFVRTSYVANDEDGKDFYSFVDDVEKDEKLKSVKASPRGFGGLPFMSVLDMKCGVDSYVFNSVEDMQAVFEHRGIECDLSDCKNESIVISRDLANNRGIKLGDKLDKSFDGALPFAVTVDAIIDDGSYATYYIYEDEQFCRLNIYSDEMEGEELYSYVRSLIGDRKVHIDAPLREGFESVYSIYNLLFYLIDVLIGVVLAVSINLVVSGHYMKRKYEFGVYMAIGKKKRDIKRKVAAEILLMEGIAIIIGAAVMLLFTYLINELYYIPSGRHLLYFSPLGIFGELLCTALVVIPLIILNGRKMCRADVTEF